MEKLTYSVQETARVLGVSKNSAYSYCAQGLIPTIRFGKRLVVPVKALNDLLDSASNQRGQ